MDKIIVDTSQSNEHYKRCKDVILSYCKEGDAFRALIGNHNHWWHTDREKGTAKLFYPADQDYDILTSKHRTLYWTAQLFSANTANTEQPYDFENYKISEQIGSREDTIYHSFFLDLDKAKTKSIEDPGVTEWLEKAIKFFADKLLAAGVSSFGLAFSGGGVYCTLHPRLGMIGENESDRAYKIEIIQKAFDLFIGDAAAEFFTLYPEAVHWVKFDKLNNDNKRQVKTLLSIHKKYPYVVIPLDKHNPKINLEDASLPISDEIIERAKGWLSYQGDIDGFGKMLLPWLEKAKSSIQKTHGKRTVNLETVEVPESEWAPCMRNMLGKKNLKSGEGATRALAVLASYMRYVGVPEEKAFTIFQRKANEWSAETSNIFESWYGCEHLDKPICFVPSCEKMRARGSGYPHPELGELEVCTPDERCKSIRSPIEYHIRSVDKLQDVSYYLKYRDRKDGTTEITGIEDKRFADDLTSIYHFKTLRDTNEVLYYEHGCYHFLGEAIIGAESERVFGEHLKTRTANEILNHIRRSTFISRNELNQNKSVLPLQNGLFSLATHTLNPFNPDVLITYKLPVEYNADADCSNIKNFVKEILNPDDIPIIQEYFGYTLLPAFPAHKSLWMYGIGRNGKSQLVSLLSKMLGDENTVSVPIEELDGWHRFSTARLFGKLLNVTSEPGVQKPLRSGLFKKIIGGDRISAEIKGIQKPIDFVNFSKFIVLGNIFPQVMDPSLAFWDRLIVVEFPNTFVDSFIPEIADKLIEADGGLSGFFNWCYEGLTRLREDGFKFTMTKSTEEMKISFEKLSNPVTAFIDEKCSILPDKMISKGNLYNTYKDYCGDGNYKIVGKAEFSKRIGELQSVNGRKARYGGSVVWCWAGINVKEEGGDDNVDIVDNVDNANVNKKGAIPSAVGAGDNLKPHVDIVDVLPNSLSSQEKDNDKCTIGIAKNVNIVNSPEKCHAEPLKSETDGFNSVGNVDIANNATSTQRQHFAPMSTNSDEKENHPVFTCFCGKKFDTIEVLRHHQAQCKEFQDAQDKEARGWLKEGGEQ